MRRYKNEHTGETIIVSSEISGGGWVEVKDEATPKKDAGEEVDKEGVIP